MLHFVYSSRISHSKIRDLCCGSGGHSHENCQVTTIYMIWSHSPEELGGPATALNVDNDTQMLRLVHLSRPRHVPVSRLERSSAYSRTHLNLILESLLAMTQTSLVVVSPDIAARFSQKSTVRLLPSGIIVFDDRLGDNASRGIDLDWEIPGRYVLSGHCH